MTINLELAKRIGDEIQKAFEALRDKPEGCIKDWKQSPKVNNYWEHF